MLLPASSRPRPEMLTEHHPVRGTEDCPEYQQCEGGGALLVVSRRGPRKQRGLLEAPRALACCSHEDGEVLFLGSLREPRSFAMLISHFLCHCLITVRKVIHLS